MQQVVLNLLINAEHALRPGATTAGRSGADVAAREPTASVIEIEDDGPGMSAEVVGRIFDPFFTTKDVGEGTGLGLAVAQAIVAEHGGHIDVASAARRGRAIRDRPACCGRNRPRRRAAHTAPVADTSDRFGEGLRVLLADDEPALAGAVADTLRDAGFEVTMASDGEEALARARAQTFDAVICDLRMPRVDGPTFYRAIAAFRPSGAAGDLRHGRCHGNRGRPLPRRERLSLACQAVPARELLRVVRDIVG